MSGIPLMGVVVLRCPMAGAEHFRAGVVWLFPEWKCCGEWTPVAGPSQSKAGTMPPGRHAAVCAEHGAPRRTPRRARPGELSGWVEGTGGMRWSAGTATVMMGAPFTRHSGMMECISADRKHALPFVFHMRRRTVIVCGQWGMIPGVCVPQCCDYFGLYICGADSPACSGGTENQRNRIK